MIRELSKAMSHPSFHEASDNDDEAPGKELEEWDDESSLGSLAIEHRPSSGGDYLPSQAYKDRLRRRTDVIRELRNAYLRDIITLKNLVNELLTNDERSVVLHQWEDCIPSLDLTQHFMLYSPMESSLDVIPCESCGGSLELVHHDSSEIEKLNSLLQNVDKGKGELKVIIASKVAQIESLVKQREEQEKKHRSEVSGNFTMALCNV